jgi:D-hydroxyproline dehydrogenase subunit gamma
MDDRAAREPHATVRLTIDGVVVEAAAGTSVAAAILNRGGTAAWHVRRSVSGAARGPLCGMGICFECRATVDGLTHVKTCQLLVRAGMEVRTDG